MGRKLELAAGGVEELRRVAAAAGSPLGDVKVLSLEGNLSFSEVSQAQELAELLAEMPRLQALNLSGCSLGVACMRALAPGLGRATELERLALGRNRFGADGVTALVDEALPHLEQLRELSLADCHLDTAAARRLAGGLRRLQRLEALQLGGNVFGEEGLRSLAEDALPSLQGLRRLSLQGLVRLGPPEAEQLAAALQRLPDLEELDVGVSGLCPRSLIALTPGLGALGRLRRLSLRHSNLGQEGARTLADMVLPKLPELLELDLVRCELEANAVVELSTGLAHLRKLERLLLEGNEFGTDGATALATAAFPHLGTLKELDLSDCSLTIAATKELAPAFKHVAGLSVLRYKGNHFGTEGATVLSAEALPHLVNLKVFDVRRCDLTRPAIEALAPGASQLPDLEVLDFGERKPMGQYVRALSFGKEEWTPKPQRFKSLDLEGSNLGSTFLAKTVASFQYLVEVETLNFKGNDFAGNFVEVLASEGLPRLVKLRDLNLTDCSLTASAMQVIAPHLGRIAGLERLSLRGNEFGEDGTKALAEHTLPHMADLKELILAHCDLGADCMKVLSPGLAHLGGLEKLVIAFNEFEEEGLEALSTAALPHLPALKELNLCSCSLEGSQVAKHLAPALGRLAALEKLVLTSNDLGEEGATALATEALPKLTALLELELAHCSMDAAAGQALAPSLRHLSRLRKLILMGNKIGLGGAKALAQEALPHLLDLVELNLSYAGLNAEAVKELAPALKQLRDLESLSLRNNAFETKGAEVLSMEALKYLKKLQCLDIRLSGIREGSMEAFAPGVARLGSLRALDLGDKRILMAFLSALPKCAEKEPVTLGGLREMALDKCDLTGDLVEEMAPGLSLLTALEVLSFRANEGFGLLGAKALSRVLPSLVSLRELHLSNCGLLGDAMQALAPSLAKVLGLEVLNLMNNNLGDDGGRALMKVVMPQLLRMKDVNVMGCGFSEEVKDAVGAARCAGCGVTG